VGRAVDLDTHKSILKSYVSVPSSNAEDSSQY
jgi:hypothetical protein